LRLLVLQHIECEHPAQLRHFLARDGIDWTAVELDEGEPIPPLEGFDAMWVMGGPMDVWDVEEHPWLLDEKEAIRTWVVDLAAPSSVSVSATSYWPTRSAARAATSNLPRSGS